MASVNKSNPINACKPVICIFNVNDYVYVKLKPLGEKELKRQHDYINSQLCGLLGEYKPKDEDENGWSKWQLHDLMRSFGHMMIGFDPPFEPEIKFEVQQKNIRRLTWQA